MQAPDGTIGHSILAPYYYLSADEMRLVAALLLGLSLQTLQDGPESVERYSIETIITLTI